MEEVVNFEYKSDLHREPVYIQYIKKVKLVDMRNNFNDLIEEVQTEKLDYRKFLIKLIQYEEQGKQKRMVDRHIKAPGFDRGNMLENYDFAFHTYRHMVKIMKLATLNFMERNENVILIGPLGVGNYRKFMFIESLSIRTY